MRKILALLFVAAIAVPAWAQMVGMNLVLKPDGTGLTPNIGDRPGVWSVEGNAPADTIATYPVFVRGARRVVWRITGSDTGSATPCSLVTVYVSNGTNPSSFTVSAATVGWTVNDYISGTRVGYVTSGGAGAPVGFPGGRVVEAIAGGGVDRSEWDQLLLVLTRKGGTAGVFDSLRVMTFVQED